MLLKTVGKQLPPTNLKSNSNVDYFLIPYYRSEYLSCKSDPPKIKRCFPTGDYIFFSNIIFTSKIVVEDVTLRVFVFPLVVLMKI